MEGKVQKWGNSLALRLPRTVAADLGLHERSRVELTVRDGAVEVRPIESTKSRLDELLAQITDENLHGEWDTGPAVGRESW